MGNWLRRSKSARYALEDDHSSSQSHPQGRPDKKSSKREYHALHPAEKVTRHIELRLAPILKNFPVRWRCFYFGSYMGVRYRNDDIYVRELGDIMKVMTTKVRALRIKPAGGLDLYAWRVCGATNDSLRSYGIRVIKNMNSIDQFAMSGLFAERAIEYAGMESFVQNIARNLYKLQRLHLSLAGLVINDQALKMISIEIGKGLVNLNSITIQFYQCENTTDQGIGLLLSGLNRYAPRLRTLRLFCSDNIDDKRMAILGENIHRNLRNLQCFKFRVNGRSLITDHGLEILGNKISRHLVNLEHLALEFSFYPKNEKISDKGVETLVSKICSNLTNLKSISLSFQDCSVTEATFMTIWKIVSQTQKNLAGLSLSFRDNKTITANAFKALSSSKKQLEHLEYLKLEFVGYQFLCRFLFEVDRCSKLSNEALIILVEWIKGRPYTLEKLFLNINHCNQITKECEDNAYTELSFIPELEISGKTRY